MKSIHFATTLLLPSIVSGFGVVDVSPHTLAISSVVTFHPGLDLLGAYKHTLAENPLQTKMITGATLAVCGDAIAQSRTDAKYDKRRASSFAAFDCVYRAVQHFSFPLIVQQCHGQYIGALVKATPGMALLVNHVGWEDPTYYYGAMEQTLSSQLGIVPFFYYPVFYTITAFVQGLDKEAAVQRAKDTFIPLMKRNLLFWIPVQFVQFGYIDENLQIPFLSVAGLVWTCIISLFAGNAKQTPHTQNNNEELIVNMRDNVTVKILNDIDVKASEVNALNNGASKRKREIETTLR